MPVIDSPLTVSADHQAKVRALVEGGLYLQALESAAPLGEIKDWQGTELQVLGGRLVASLGAPRLAAHLIGKAYRSDRLHPVAAYYRASRLFRDFGPYRAWRFFQKLPTLADGHVGARADLLALQARVFASYRDFTWAEEKLTEAFALNGETAWLWCERAEVQRAHDQNEAALVSVQRALEMRPHYRPAVLTAAETLQALNRDQEALALLTEASERLESGAVVHALAILQSELDDRQGALASWRRIADLHPLVEPHFKEWLDARLADAHYHAGDYAQAREYALKTGGSFYEEFAKRLEGSPERHRVFLPVQFVAQHHMTCAPATMSALSLYWQVPVDHLKLAAEICYEGTFDHAERQWAEGAGFVVREFAVDWDTACRLVDAGVPFALATTETTSGHLQAIIGYDRLRETLLIRDPSYRVYREVAGREFLQSYAAFGPRGMIMLPASEAHRLDGITLPDSELYDIYYRLQSSVESHDREAAARAYEDLVRVAPEHRLAFIAKRRLDFYDANSGGELEALNKLTALFPQSGHFLWHRVNVLARSAHSSDVYIESLKALATGPVVEPVFHRDWARELRRDGRRLHEAYRYNLLALRRQPVDADNIGELAHTMWEERQYEMATALYRLAACLPGGGERYGRSYFIAARHVRKTEEALAFLRERFEASGKASIQPVRVLFNALTTLERDGEALALLDEALRLRPHDGELLLFAADEFARRNQEKKAMDLLAAARPFTSRSASLRTEASMAQYRCDQVGALGLWQRILEQEPLATDALRAIARLLAETEGRPTTLDFLQQQSERFPHFAPLWELYAEWLSNEPPETAEPIIRRALEINRDNAWTHRELALNLARQRKFDEALRIVRDAVSMEPTADAHSLAAHILRLSGRPDAAAEEWRTALKLSVDCASAMRGLCDISSTHAEKKQALEFIRTELINQVMFGDGVGVFREEAFAVLPPVELLGMLREAHQARPDLWQSWVAVVQQLIDMGGLDEALRLATEATQKFPLLPRCWHQLAEVRKAQGQRQEEIAALTQALALNPTWSMASRSLADVHDRNGDFSQARLILEQAVSHAPLDFVNHGCLAEMLWKLGEKERALDSVVHAIRLSPGYTWAWNALSAWSGEVGRENLSWELAQELAQSRAGEARSWVRLALEGREVEPRLEAIDRAIALEPRDPELHDTRAMILAEAGRYDEAEAACCPVVFETIPHMLEGRLAWIKADRGDVVSAISLMKSAVERAPDYYWGWNRLVDWYMYTEKHEKALKAAEQMARLAPRSFVPLGYIGDIHLKAGNPNEAREAFQKAFALDPSYEYAAFQVFDGFLKSTNYAKAEEMLTSLKLYHPGARTEACEVQLRARQGRRDEAMAGLRALCFTPEKTTYCLRMAANAAKGEGWLKEKEQLLRSLLNEPGLNPEVGAIWVEAFTEAKVWFSERRMEKLDARSPVGLAARRAFLDKCTSKDKQSSILAMLNRDREALQSDPQCWGMMGYSLVTLELYPAAIEWLQDWKSQKSVEPWMLFNLCISLRTLGRDAEAHEVGIHALNLRGDGTTLRHHLLVAWDEAMAGNVEMAAQRLAVVPKDGLSLYFELVRGLVVALVQVRRAEGADLAREFDTHKIILQQEAWRAQFKDKLLKRMGGDTTRVLAEVAGCKPFRIGGWWDFGPNVGWGIFFVGMVAATFLRGCGGGN